MSEHRYHEWEAVRIVEKRPIGYAAGPGLLADLREVAAPARFYELRQEHARASAFISRRVHPGLSKACR